jgi:sulfur-oxidizing protein SoxB
MSLASAAGLVPPSVFGASEPHDLYRIANKGDIRLVHITDTHAQLNPVYFREPSVNLGFNQAYNKAPHLVGPHFIERFKIKPDTALAHAFTSVNFETAAGLYGKVGGFAHIKTLVDQLRANYGQEKTLLLDGGDTWQGSGTANWTNGMDMVGACNLLGVDVMTGHWEFTYPDKQVMKNLKAFNGEFIAQNIKVKEDALFEGAKAFDEDSGHTFKPYIVRELNGHKVAIIGQAFPYTPIANPSRFMPDWTFGINEQDMQEMVDQVRSTEKPAAVILLSHNGMDVDLKMASRVSGIDVILGGHTHDGIPQPIKVSNSTGITLVTNAGSNGKFVGVLDLTLSSKGVAEFQYKLLPVFSNFLPADKEMQSYIDKVRSPFIDKLAQPLAVADELLYRRGNFNGTFDQVICDALRSVNDSEIALSPGFRWGTTILPGQTITMEHLLNQTSITYPETYVREMKGDQLKLILEDVADNLFNPDPYYQQGGDMVRLGGLDYVLDPLAKMGNRISDLTLDNGKTLNPSKTYKVSGWATVGAKSSGPPVSETVSEYLKQNKRVGISKLNTPKIKLRKGNKGTS